MKVTGPSSGSPGAAPSAGKGVDGAPGDVAAGKSEGTGKAFAEKLGGADPAARGAPSAPASSGPGAGERPSATADIAADLQSGRLQPKGAIEKLLDRVVARQVGADAPPAVRERVRAALQETLENDPLLSEKLRSLDG